MAAAVALCVENGWLDYDAPVAQYWPEFSANNKENILLRDVLSHRAGLPFVDQQLTVNDTFDWSRMTSLLASQKPHWEPGTAHGYHAHTIGYIVGELIHRVDPQHRSYGQFVRDELDNEFYVGVPNDKVEARVAPLIQKQENSNTNDALPMDQFTEKALTCNGAFPMKQPSKTIIAFNEARLHRAELPASNGITNARSLARIYALLIGDVNENGEKKKCLLKEQTLARATKNVTPPGEPDRTLFGWPTVYGMGGFEIYSDDFKTLGSNVFGHTGKIFKSNPCSITCKLFLCYTNIDRK
ncbi:unnamed protein product [Rotaria sp. Silwood1]|nr:unnamed protein product [Rotaria sp. Silwood1]CAF1536977.1 unnamed protein product [Rotaria sp. Silwood1]CAF1537105.1 unnamed protein product [Rotaria sp. Silwood1]CAF3626409.1 unnamed protein product [Rotaria sp. Silwood1]CAF3694971.1 unnamed protein product [Rotaria sp. Silwood1]